MGRHKKNCQCEICLDAKLLDAPTTPFPAPVSVGDALPLPAAIDHGMRPVVSLTNEEQKAVWAADPNLNFAKAEERAKKEKDIVLAIVEQVDMLERRKVLSFGPLFRMARELRALRGKN